jgi:hypothetical protein
MLGLHLVLVTLHGCFTISIERDKHDWLYTMLCVAIPLLTLEYALWSIIRSSHVVHNVF